MRRAGTLAGLVCLALLAPGCGGAMQAPAAVSNLEREDLLAVVHELATAQPQVGAELAAAKQAWRVVADGVPATAGSAARAAVHRAAERAAAVFVPALFDEYSGRNLTGPAASLAGLFRGYERLNTPSWRQLTAAIDLGADGPTASVRFYRSNSPLYVDGVYDAHFTLAQIGRRLLAAYTQLGGPSVFQQSLTQAEVDKLANAYSEQRARLHPHAGVKIGT
jgi:hypothetical protein